MRFFGHTLFKLARDMVEFVSEGWQSGLLRLS